MLWGATDPLKSRVRFKARMLENIVALAGGFILVVCLASALISFIFPSFLLMLVADVTALSVVFYFYTVWQNRPIGVRCGHCRKVVMSNTPWVCGNCEEENRDAGIWPIFGPCAHCKDEVKAYRCHHCGDFIFFSEDEDRRNYAYRLNAPNEVRKTNERAEKVLEQGQAIEDKKHEVAMADLEAALKALQAKIDGPKVKTPLDIKVEMCEREFVGIMGVREYCRKKRQEVAVTFKDHPQELEEANRAIDHIAAMLT